MDVGHDVLSEKPQLSLFESSSTPGKKPLKRPEPRKTAGPRKKRKAGGPLTAEEMGAQQRDISVAEFFTKNRHLLGFDNATKALLTTVKEAVDNSLDAAEEAGLLPEITVEISPLKNTNGSRSGTNGNGGDPNAPERFIVAVTDNGPGVVKAQIPKIFGKLLYGSKFHRLRQSRGQQGIGISAAGMYGQLTTGQPTTVISRTGKGRPAHRFEVLVNTQKNQPETVTDEVVDWDLDHGTKVVIALEARYQRGAHSVDEYLRQCAVANPHARFVYRTPDGEETIFERGIDDLPKSPKEIKPHPYGVELGVLMKMLKTTKATKLRAFLASEFSRVSLAVASEICDVAGLSQNAWVSRIAREEADRLYQAIPRVKIRRPPTDCLAPIGAEAITAGLTKEFEPEFVHAVSRSPSVYRGNPFAIEVGVAFGGKLKADESVKVIRFANRVPLLYQQSACAINKALGSVPWRNYGVQHPKGGLPMGPLVVFVHFSSVWVPFTSESKEAIAHYPEILKELRLCMQDCGRVVGRHIRRQKRLADAEKKRSYIEKYLPHIGIALQEILGLTDAEREETFLRLIGILNRSRKP